MATSKGQPSQTDNDVSIGFFFMYSLRLHFWLGIWEGALPRSLRFDSLRCQFRWANLASSKRFTFLAHIFFFICWIFFLYVFVKIIFWCVAVHFFWFEHLFCVAWPIYKTNLYNRLLTLFILETGCEPKFPSRIWCCSSGAICTYNCRRTA